MTVSDTTSLAAALNNPGAAAPPLMNVGNASGGAVLGSSNPAVAAAAVTLKTKQEIHTSLHLIKDIRRLETYQRDFFLKVKESLSAVQMLLDHQLMDATWFNNLIECEENLLKSALQLTSVTPSQVSEIYGNILRDRETLNRRFMELVTKSSLSEFIVNSGQILDVNTVRSAADAILKNEKPIRTKQDKSVPIDHTFFLANFCVSSLASGLMFRPSSSTRSAMSSTADHSLGLKKPASYTPNNNDSNPDYLTNGNDAHLSERFATKVGLMDAGYYKTGSDFSVSAKAFVPSAVPGEGGFNAGGMFGQELVSAITQIAYQDDKKQAAVVPASTTVSQQHKATNPWQKEPDTLPNNSTDNYFGRNGFDSATAATSGTVTAVNNDASTVTTVSTSSSVAVESSDADSSVDGANSTSSDSKPLSFARIASLNLEKQAVSRALNIPPGSGAAVMQQPPLMSSLPNNGNLDHRQAAAAAAVAAHQAAVAAAAAAMQQQQQQQQQALMLPSPHLNLPPSVNPRFFLDIVMEGKKLGRVIIEVEPMVAPKMAQNFQMLVTGEKGYGYRGCQFFQAWKNESVICGDWEHNSGRGGRAAFDGGALFTPDETKLACIRGAVGMRRMSKKHSTLNQVASQFRIILANMHTQFSGIFGHVISGIEALDKVANVGGEGGRPEKIASVQSCGIYKP